MGRTAFWAFVLIAIFTGVSNTVTAQNFTITGTVRDSVSSFTLSGVTATAYYSTDSTLMDVQLTDNTGKFVLTGKLRDGSIDLYINFTGYLPFHRLVRMDTSQPTIQTDSIRLLRNYESLDEVVVRMMPPVSMNGDTLEINPSAFRMGENAVVEDLLKKVNGIVVWGDGTITVNGKKVDHMLVDGKSFISDNARIATQNLPKSAIEKIQVFREKDVALATLKADSLLTMNIQLKEDRKTGYIGKMAAGYGTSLHHDLGLTGLLYRRQSKLALAAMANNINKKISDVQAALENNTFKNTNPNLSDAPDFDMNGQNLNRLYGMVYQHSFRPKKRMFLANDIRVEINRTDNKGELNSDLLQSASINNSHQTVHSTITSNNSTHISNAAVSYTKKDANTVFQMSAILDELQNILKDEGLTTQHLNGVQGSENTSLHTNEHKKKNISLKGKYNYSDKKSRGLKSLYFTYEMWHSRSYEKQAIQNHFKSFVGGIPDFSLDREYDIENETTKGNFNLLYPGLKRLLFGIRALPDFEMSLNNQLRLSGEHTAHSVWDFDEAIPGYTPNTALSYTDDLDSVQYKPSIAIRKLYTKDLYGRMERSFDFEITTMVNFLTLNNASSIWQRNLNRTYSFFEPAFSFHYSHQNNARRIKVGYMGNLKDIVPEMNQLFPVTDSINPYDIRFGNPFLRTEHLLVNSFSAEYKDVRANRRHNFFALLNTTYSHSNRAVADSVINDDAGRSVHFPVNVSFRKNWIIRLEANYSAGLHENPLQIQYKGIINKVTVPGFINGDRNVSEFLFFNSLLSASWSFSKFLTVDIRENIYISQFRLSTFKTGASKNNLYNTALNTNIRFHKHVIFSNSLNYLSNPSMAYSFLLWNSYFTWRFSVNERWELKVAAFDILRNYKNIKTDIGYNFNTTTVNSGLQQFFMVSFAYYPRFF